jgi:predicted nucleic acid-binding protein
LGKLNRLDLLADLFGEVQIPHAVFHEVVIQGLIRGEPDALTVRLFWQRLGWPVVELTQAQRADYVPPVILDPGETEVLALARSLDDALVLLDDEVARAEARRLGLGVLGTLGVLARAYRQGFLSVESAELLIREIAERPDIWISPRLCMDVIASLRLS